MSKVVRRGPAARVQIRKVGTFMTGSALAPVIIPVVVIAALAAWLGMIYYADAHPGYHSRRTVSKPGTARADTARRQVRSDGRALHDGDDASGASTAPGQRAA